MTSDKIAHLQASSWTEVDHHPYHDERATMPTFSTTEQTTISPHNQQPLVTRTYPTSNEHIDNVIEGAASAQKQWAKLPLEKRIELGLKFVVCLSYLGYTLVAFLRLTSQEEFKKEADEIPLDLTLQMGR